jgi:hypothetical protein
MALGEEPIEFLANDERGAAFLWATAEREGKHLDVTMAEDRRFESLTSTSEHSDPQGPCRTGPSPAS